MGFSPGGALICPLLLGDQVEGGDQYLFVFDAHTLLPAPPRPPARAVLPCPQPICGMKIQMWVYRKVGSGTICQSFLALSLDLTGWQVARGWVTARAVIPSSLLWLEGVGFQLGWSFLGHLVANLLLQCILGQAVSISKNYLFKMELCLCVCAG